ncbi:MAG: UDP-3-O-(3-hydroxymyristoyl)glucosamine N-acyltransferase [Candidatus Baltobacteraceae bacterium]
MLGTLAQLAARTGGTVQGDAGVCIGAISAIDQAGPDALTFATSAAYLQTALASKAAAVLVDEALADALETAPTKPLIKVASARVALMQLLREMDRPRKRGPFVHPSAAVDPAAAIGADVYIGALAIVGARSTIGEGTVIEGGAYIGEDVRVGAGALISPHARILDGCIAGDRVILHPGATVGSEGFGYVFIDGKFEHIPQVGNVVLEADVEIGANACVDRAQTGSTHIGAGTKIDNLVQVGHNCKIGSGTAIAAQSGLSGSTVIGDFVQIAGQAGTRGHMSIGSRSIIAGKSGVWGDVPEGSFVSGNPARPHKEELRREVMVRNLPKLVARVDALEKRNP